MGLAPLRAGQFLSTRFDVVPVVLVVVALSFYLWGVQRVRRYRPRHPWSVGKTLAFIGALVSTSLAVFSFIGVYQQELFWDHMVQHLLLIMVAAPLFAISSPIDLAWRATTGRAHARITTMLRSRPSRFFGHPIVAFCLYAVMIPLTHLTSWYNYTLEHAVWDNLEHLVFLVIGYLFYALIRGEKL